MRKRPLSDFPLALEFTAHVAKNTKGRTIDFWRNELQKYDINGVCGCGHCQTFYLSASVHTKSYFEKGGHVCDFYGKKGLETTCVILHADDNGFLNEIELPQITDVPYKNEYNYFTNANYRSKIQSSHLAQKIVKRWFQKNKVQKPFVIVIDNEEDKMDI